MTVSLLSIYNTVNGSLSFAVTIPDATHNEDAFALIFKTNTTADLVDNSGGWTFGVGYDIKVIYCVDNTTADGVTYNDQLDGALDTDVGGSEDTYATGTWDGTKYVYEMHTFLFLIDPNGADYQLAENDQIEFFVFYQEDLGTIYSQIREDEGDFEYCTLNIGAPVLSGTTLLFVISSLIASFTVMVFVYRKKK
ncbi:MAG: hypothetical protein ACTSO7_11365 [Candidatus Heimdallarchaeota archaeon]